MKVSDVMTRSPLTVSADTSLEEAATAMLKARVSGLPVVDPEGNVVGMLTEGDLLRRVELGTAGRPAGWLAAFVSPGRVARHFVRTHGHKVGEIMTRKVVSVAPEAPLSEVVDLMESQQIKRLPVVQKHRLIGIVSRADLLRALLKLLPERRVVAISDAELRKRVLAEIDKQTWTPRQAVDATVENGVVELRGAVSDDQERVGLRVIAENTPGVKGVHDRLIWVEPISGVVMDAPKE